MKRCQCRSASHGPDCPLLREAEEDALRDGAPSRGPSRELVAKFHVVLSDHARSPALNAGQAIVATLGFGRIVHSCDSRGAFDGDSYFDLEVPIAKLGDTLDYLEGDDDVRTFRQDAP